MKFFPSGHFIEDNFKMSQMTHYMSISHVFTLCDHEGNEEKHRVQKWNVCLIHLECHTLCKSSDAFMSAFRCFPLCLKFKSVFVCVNLGLMNSVNNAIVHFNIG